MLLTAVPLRPDGSPRLDTDTLVVDLRPCQRQRPVLRPGPLAVAEGRMADPDRADEVVMTPPAAQLLGFHVGQVIPYGLYTQEQQNLPDFGTPNVPPHRRSS